MASLRPLKKEIDFVRARLQAWESVLKSSSDPSAKKVAGEITTELSNWDYYGLGYNVKY